MDAIYIPVLETPVSLWSLSEQNSNLSQLPNSLHYEWTIKALSAGKHILVEKPIVTRTEEALKMHELAEQKGLVLLEAMHIRYAQARFYSTGVHMKSGDGE